MLKSSLCGCIPRSKWTVLTGRFFFAGPSDIASNSHRDPFEFCQREEGVKSLLVSRGAMHYCSLSCWPWRVCKTPRPLSVVMLYLIYYHLLLNHRASALPVYHPPWPWPWFHEWEKSNGSFPFRSTPTPQLPT
jgi:hypothetical protein